MARRLSAIRRHIGIVWGITQRNLLVQRKYPINYVYRLFPVVKDSLYAIFLGIFLTISVQEYAKVNYAYFLLSGYIVWFSVSAAFYSVVADFQADQMRKNTLSLYLYGVSFAEMALGYDVMQTINAILFSIPFVVTLGIIGVNLAISLTALASIFFFYVCSWLFLFSGAIIMLGLNILLKETSLLHRALYDAIALLSGLSFGVEVIPEPIHSLVYFLPTYYLLKTTRYVLLENILPPNLSLYLPISVSITVTLLVFALFFLRRCVRTAKKRGILWTY